MSAVTRRVARNRGARKLRIRVRNAAAGVDNMKVQVRGERVTTYRMVLAAEFAATQRSRLGKTRSAKRRARGGAKR